jgi:hypothetical protein
MPTTYAIPNGAAAMAATTYTATPGTGATISNAVNGVSFQPDLVWVKSRDAGEQHYWQDSVRGFSPSANVTKMLNSNSTAAESSLSDITCTTTSSGFTVVDSNPGTGEFWLTNRNYVAWSWKANGAAVTNTAGSITSQVSANTAAGFSVVTYTGTGANATVGHGLGVAPSMIIVKNRNAVISNPAWPVYHSVIAATNYLDLQTTAASAASVNVWNNTAPTSSVFSIGVANSVSGNTNGLVAYCFAAVPGYSAFGAWQNNNSTDGTFIYTGFRPRFILLKNYDNVERWFTWDSTRQTYNMTPPSSNWLVPNDTAAEGANGATTAEIDGLSNGFKIRTTNPASGEISFGTRNYIYACFAEMPFKYANAR